MGFVGAGPVSARKNIEGIIANVVGVALLGDPQCIAEIALTNYNLYKVKVEKFSIVVYNS